MNAAKMSAARWGWSSGVRSYLITDIKTKSEGSMLNMKIFNIRDYGARISDTLQTQIIQKTIDDCFLAGAGASNLKRLQWKDLPDGLYPLTEDAALLSV